jgi:hypothetical protein
MGLNRIVDRTDRSIAHQLTSAVAAMQSLAGHFVVWPISGHKMLWHAAKSNSIQAE